MSNVLYPALLYYITGAEGMSNFERRLGILFRGVKNLFRGDNGGGPGLGALRKT